MTKLQITTKYGNRYLVDEQANIIRTDIPGFQASGQWKLLGIEHVKKGLFVRAENLADWLKIERPLLYKNGDPQYTVRDLDHGTTRTWGNTKYHGIASIQVVEV
jgi:hypothetical protein